MDRAAQRCPGAGFLQRDGAAVRVAERVLSEVESQHALRGDRHAAAADDVHRVIVGERVALAGDGTAEDQIHRGAGLAGEVQQVAGRAGEGRALDRGIDHGAGVASFQRQAVVIAGRLGQAEGAAGDRDAVQRAAGVDDRKIATPSAADAGVGHGRRTGQAGGAAGCAEIDAAFAIAVDDAAGAVDAVDGGVAQREAADREAANAEVVEVVELHPVERDVGRAVQEDADARGGAAVRAGLVLNRAAAASRAVAGDRQAASGTGADETDADAGAPRARAGRDAAEGQAARADGRVGDVERDARRRADGADDARVILGGADYGTAAGRVEAGATGGGEAQAAREVDRAAGVGQVDGVGRRGAGGDQAGEGGCAAGLGVDVHRVVGVVVLGDRALVGHVGSAGVLAIGDAARVVDRRVGAEGERAGGTVDDVDARVAAIERRGAVEVVRGRTVGVVELQAGAVRGTQRPRIERNRAGGVPAADADQRGVVRLRDVAGVGRRNRAAADVERGPAGTAQSAASQIHRPGDAGQADAVRAAGRRYRRERCACRERARIEVQRPAIGVDRHRIDAQRTEARASQRRPAGVAERQTAHRVAAGQCHVVGRRAGGDRRVAAGATNRHAVDHAQADALTDQQLRVLQLDPAGVSRAAFIHEDRVARSVGISRSASPAERREGLKRRVERAVATTSRRAVHIPDQSGDVHRHRPGDDAVQAVRIARRVLERRQPGEPGRRRKREAAVRVQHHRSRCPRHIEPDRRHPHIAQRRRRVRIDIIHQHARRRTNRDRRVAGERVRPIVKGNRRNHNRTANQRRMRILIDVQIHARRVHVAAVRNRHRMLQRIARIGQPVPIHIRQQRIHIRRTNADDQQRSRLQSFRR